MNNNKFLMLLIQPFTHIAGWQAFALGLAFTALMGVTGTWSKVYFDGVLDMHLTQHASLSTSFMYLCVNTASLVLTMYLASLIIGKNIRFIDILGTMTLAKAPYLLLAIAGFFTQSPDMNEIMSHPELLFKSTSFIIVTLVSIPVIVWSVTLMYNALKISSGAKGTKLTTAFIIALLCAEILSKIIILKI